MGLSREFKYDQITGFNTWYVTGFGPEDLKLRAWTSLPKFRSAFSDYAVLHALHWPGRRTMRRINKHYRGLQNKYPHTVKRDAIVGVTTLRAIGTMLGFHHAGCLETCSSLVDLVFWARIVVAHSALLRPVAHSRGMQVQDFQIARTRIGGPELAFLVVGRRRCERKLKHKSRRVPLPLHVSHLSAGHVLRVLHRRVHRGSRASAPLFPDLRHSASCRDGLCVPWSVDRAHLERLCRRAGVRGPISGRSLRAGGATDLFAVGATRQYVKHQGGWGAGFVFSRYDRPTPEARVFLASRFAARLRSFVA